MKQQIKSHVPTGVSGHEITQSFGDEVTSIIKQEEKDPNYVSVTESYKYNNREYRKNDFNHLEGKVYSKHWFTIGVHSIKEDRKGTLRRTGESITLDKIHLIQFAKNLLALADKMEDRNA